MTTTAPTLRDMAAQHQRDARLALFDRLKEQETTATSNLEALLTTITNGTHTTGRTLLQREPAGAYTLASRVRLQVPGDDLVLWQYVDVFESPNLGPDASIGEPHATVPCPTCKHPHTNEVHDIGDLFRLYTTAAECCGKGI